MAGYAFDDDEPSRQTGYALASLDRLGDKRGDAGLIAGFLAGHDARFVLFEADRPVMVAGAAKTAVVDRAGAERLGGRFEAAIFLGVATEGAARGAPHFALPRGEAALPESVEAGDLRALAIEGEVAAAELSILAAAKSLVDWHRRHGFCSTCGTATVPAFAGWRRDCPSCGAQHFPRTDPVVIMLASDGERCILGRQARFAPGMYSCLAGFVEPGETIEDAVRREVLEESGVRVGRVRYVASQPWPFPSSLMIGCLAEAPPSEIRPDEVELEDCRWFPRAEVRAMLAGTHADGLRGPPEMAIANRLIRLWAEG